MALSADPPPPVVMLPDAGAASLYQEIILAHYRAPKHKGTIDGAPAATEHTNPLCGDVLSVQLVLDDHQIANAAFTARACSITQATASMLLSRVIGGSTADAEVLIAHVDRLLDSSVPLSDAEGGELGDLRALASVARFPARKACVRLVLGAVRGAIGGASPHARLPATPARRS
jgi:nitrogen fixation protein NifU and related proteins